MAILILIITIIILGYNFLKSNKGGDLNYVKNNDVTALNVQRLYKIQNDQIQPIQSNKNQDSDMRLWTLFTNIIPKEIRIDINLFEVINDKNANLVANITNPDGDNSWKLKINEANIYKANNSGKYDIDFLKRVFIHEIGHLITLNSSQVSLDSSLITLDDKTKYKNMFSELEKKCNSSYFVQEGCSKIDSYINIFYNQFWLDKWSEYSKMQQIENSQDFSKASDGFYQKYNDNFISRTAAINPEEDIAETFSYFVLNDKPNDKSKISNQKILWFWSEPGLVDIRQKIIKHLSVSQ